MSQKYFSIFAGCKFNNIFATNMPFKKKNTIKYTTFAFLLAFMGLVLPDIAEAENSDGAIKCVVIDPGHGGHDPGTIWGNGKYKEKDIVLSVSLKLGRLIKAKYPNVKILYTRTTDKYVELGARSDFANRNRADLFISVHVNSTGTTSVTGTETFVMGTHKSESNFELVKAENSVIVLEDNYRSKYEGFDPNSPESYIIFSLLQNVHLEQSLRFAELVQKRYRTGPIPTSRGVKQGGLIVLWKSTMPAVLTEIGFLSNAKDRAVLISREGQDKIADNLFKAFCDYKTEMEQIHGGEINDSNPEKVAATAPANENEYYAIQILSVTKPLAKNAADLKGLKEYICIQAAGRYKYVIGRFKSKNEAQRELADIRKRFKGAFVIRVKNGKIEI